MVYGLRVLYCSIWLHETTTTKHVQALDNSTAVNEEMKMRQWGRGRELITVMK